MNIEYEKPSPEHIIIAFMIIHITEHSWIALIIMFLDVNISLE